MKKQNYFRSNTIFDYPNRIVFFSPGRETPQEGQNFAEKPDVNKLHKEYAQKQLQGELDRNEQSQEQILKISPPALTVMQNLNVRLDADSHSQGVILKKNGNPILKFAKVDVNSNARGQLTIKYLGYDSSGNVDNKTEEMTISPAPFHPDWLTINDGQKIIFITDNGEAILDQKHAEQLARESLSKREKEDNGVEKAQERISRILKDKQALLLKYGFEVNPNNLSGRVTKNFQVKKVDEGEQRFTEVEAGGGMNFLDEHKDGNKVVYNTDLSFEEKNGVLIYKGKESSGKTWEWHIKGIDWKTR